MADQRSWSLDCSGDNRYSLQCKGQEGVFRFLGIIRSPEWMVAVTVRHIVKTPSSIKHGIAEYRLTGSNLANSLVPDNLSDIDYLWWRLSHYFKISKNKPYDFSDGILQFCIDAARIMWDSTEVEYYEGPADDVSTESHPAPPPIILLNEPRNSVKLVAWAPKGLSPELTAVRLPPGKVTERDWWEALADRVSDLAVAAGEEETQAACNALNVPMTEELYQVGQSLVLHNLVLMQALDLIMAEGNPFPATVGEPSQEAKDALELNLTEWVDQALSVVSESSLD